MQYPGPTALDFDDVRALNRALLNLLASNTDLAAGLRDDLAAQLRTLSRYARSCLAEAPFLLMSFREHDQALWDRVHERNPDADLFAGLAGAATDRSRLAAAGLGFAWQLARRNPYALRLVCGASLHWCERLCDSPLMDVITRVSAHDDLLVLRSAGDVNFWSKLLTSGVSCSEQVRTAAHLTALQMMLTRPPQRPARPWATAACRTRVPTLSVADKGER